jgi:hypothetical protein
MCIQGHLIREDSSYQEAAMMEKYVILLPQLPRVQVRKLCCIQG